MRISILGLLVLLSSQLILGSPALKEIEKQANKNTPLKNETRINGWEEIADPLFDYTGLYISNDSALSPLIWVGHIMRGLFLTSMGNRERIETGFAKELCDITCSAQLVRALAVAGCTGSVTGLLENSFILDYISANMICPASMMLWGVYDSFIDPTLCTETCHGLQSRMPPAADTIPAMAVLVGLASLYMKEFDYTYTDEKGNQVTKKQKYDVVLGGNIKHLVFSGTTTNDIWSSVFLNEIIDPTAAGFRPSPSIPLRDEEKERVLILAGTHGCGLPFVGGKAPFVGGKSVLSVPGVAIEGDACNIWNIVANWYRDRIIRNMHIYVLDVSKYAAPKTFMGRLDVVFGNVNEKDKAKRKTDLRAEICIFKPTYVVYAYCYSDSPNNDIKNLLTAKPC